MLILLELVYICKCKHQYTDDSAHPCTLLHAYVVRYLNTIGPYKRSAVLHKHCILTSMLMTVLFMYQAKVETKLNQ